MTAYQALTWDHPRGYNALAAAAAGLDSQSDGFTIQWHKQPLEGFESHPIADLCARFDLVVLDHPHVGEAVDADCLMALEGVFGETTVGDIGRATIGPCLSSYFYAGRHWALPLDAATQVAASRADLLDGQLPTTWPEVRELSHATGKVALSLAGPHAILSFLSVATALGEPPAGADPELLVNRQTGLEALDLLCELARRSPRSVSTLNPIDILDHMATQDDVILCPLIYGYVNYAAPGARARPIRFSNAPRFSPAGRPGSTLGGTGIGISKRCHITPELTRHLMWLLGEEAQTGFIPAHEGQPSRRSAWLDTAVNARWNDFYRDTAETLEHAYVRPRHNGYIAFQTRASALLREAFADRRTSKETLAELEALYRASRRAGTER